MGTEQQAIPCENGEVETDVKTCEKRFDKRREKRKWIVHYLRHGKHLDALNKNVLLEVKRRPILYMKVSLFFSLLQKII